MLQMLGTIHWGSLSWLHLICSVNCGTVVRAGIFWSRVLLPVFEQRSRGQFSWSLTQLGVGLSLGNCCSHLRALPLCTCCLSLLWDVPRNSSTAFKSQVQSAGVKIVTPGDLSCADPLVTHFLLGQV